VTLRRRLMTFGVPLVVLPLAASLVIFSVKMAETEEGARFQVLEAELALVKQHVEAAWTVLSRVGFEQSEFYQKAVSQAVETNLKAVASPGETALIVDHTGTVLLGPDDWRGRRIGVSDPWHVVLEDSAGEHVLASRHLTEDKPYLVAFRRFVPWNWAMVTITQQSLIWSNVGQGLALAVVGSLGFLALAVVGFWFLARGATRPVVELQALAGRMGRGRFDLRAEVTGPDEVVALAREWNAMAARVEQLTAGLEQRVEERTRDLAAALDHTKAMQDQLILSEKMASLGQLVAGIAHELNTPLGAIESAHRNLDELLGAGWPVQMEALARLPQETRGRLWGWLDRAKGSRAVTDSLTRRRLRKELGHRFAEAGIMEPEETADRFVDVGLLDWEVSDLVLLSGKTGRPLVAILGELAQARLASSLVGLAVTKAERVIGALRIYSRHDPVREASLVSVAESFSTVLTLLQNRLKGGVEVVSEVSPDLRVRVDADRLDQLLTNLIGNALAAMDNRGRLTLEANLEGAAVIRVIDTGPGIPENLQGRIFTPFFTTKKAGEGSGLGLSICQTIVQEAGGTLTFRSKPGHTVFEVRLPCL